MSEVLQDDLLKVSDDLFQHAAPPLENRIDLPDELLASYWRQTDWVMTEHLLETYQRELALAATRKDYGAVRSWQAIITDNIDIKKLAVKAVLDDNPRPGPDRIVWRTDAEKMRGAILLQHENYRATPVLHFTKVDNFSHKERTYGIPTIRDRCMQWLYAKALDPVSESQADRKSFAFRRGRSQLDVHYYVLDALNRKNSPQWVLIADVRSFYDSIDHQWLIDHIPMRKNVLREFLKSGIALEPHENQKSLQGMNLGSTLSPILANMVLDGLQHRLHALQLGDHSQRVRLDFAEGNLIRFADDILVTARTRESALRIKQELEDFLAERHLLLSSQKVSAHGGDSRIRLLAALGKLSADRIERSVEVHLHYEPKNRDSTIDP